MAYRRRPGDIHNLPEVAKTRKRLRKHLTPAEAKLWTLLKDAQLDGRKFRRQHSVGRYVLDFYCPSEKLAIELDGELHYTLYGGHRDSIRTEFLKRVGIKVLRIENKLVFTRQIHVLERIRREFTNDQEKSDSKK